MPLIKDGTVVEDAWVAAPDDGPLPSGGAILTLEQWHARADELKGANVKLGIRLKSSDSPYEIADDLGRFELVALEFPAYKDGRAYSYARLLRERWGFKGELRAVGDVLRDQALYMSRCGFDAYDIKDPAKVEGFIQAMNDMTVFYQPTGDGRKTVIEERKGG